MENQHELTLVLERPERLLVELDEHVLLTFTGPDLGVAESTGERGRTELSFSGYEQAVVDARHYGSPGASLRWYREGTIRLVS